MSELRIRNVEPWAVEVIRAMARRTSRSMEQLVRDVLYELADKEKAALLTELRAVRTDQQAKHGELPDSTPGIRAEREARW